MSTEANDGQMTPQEALQAGREAARFELLQWAVKRWRLEVENRPLVNVHRRSLDDTWRQVIRYAKGDADVLLGPDHDSLVAGAEPRARWCCAGVKTDDPTVDQHEPHCRYHSSNFKPSAPPPESK